MLFAGVFFVLLAIAGAIGAGLTSPRERLQYACAVLFTYLSSILAAFAFTIHYEVF